MHDREQTWITRRPPTHPPLEEEGRESGCSWIGFGGTICESSGALFPQGLCSGDDYWGGEPGSDGATPIGIFAWPADVDALPWGKLRSAVAQIANHSRWTPLPPVQRNKKGSAH